MAVTEGAYPIALPSSPSVPPKRLLGPASRQSPRLDDDRLDRAGDELDDHELLEDVEWTGGAPASVTGVEIVRSRLTSITFTGLELTDLRLLDVELVECELSGAVLTASRWERVVLRRCRMSGLVAAELRATDVRLQDCQADQAWLRASVLDRCELVDTDLRGADLYGAGSRDRRSVAAISPRSTCRRPSSSRSRSTAPPSTASREPNRCEG